jgi:hypothetical protein
MASSLRGELLKVNQRSETTANVGDANAVAANEEIAASRNIPLDEQYPPNIRKASRFQSVWEKTTSPAHASLTGAEAVRCSLP